MKNLTLLLVLLVFAACGDEDNSSSASNNQTAKAESTASFAASPDQDTAKYIPIYIHDIPPANVINSPNTPSGGYGQVLVPDMSKGHAQILTSKYWVVEGYADSNGSGLQRLHGLGQWLKFNPDGTFSGGHWDRQTHGGAWYMDYQFKNPRITLDSNVDRQDAVWEMQGMTGEQDAMAWIRIRDSGFGPKLGDNIAWKIIALDNMPTKEQFAGQMRY